MGFRGRLFQPRVRRAIHPFPARESEKKREKGDGLKRCRKCGQVKRSQEFRRNARCRDGLSSWCADCHVEATHAYRQRRREAEAEATRKAIKAHTEELRRWEAERRARLAVRKEPLQLSPLPRSGPRPDD
jgi:hypothetical protein